MLGFPDVPRTSMHGENGDELDIKPYINALTAFIQECDTPMTIAIQGDWGSGKTSLMNMVQENLGDTILTSWFNTWQYSQFNMDNELVLSLLRNLISSLSPEEDTKKKLGSLMKAFLTKAAVLAVDTVVGGEAAGLIKNGVEKAENKNNIDSVEAIGLLKKAFEVSVKETKLKQGKERIAIFIDDLDRLNPGKAVELLEVLKLFLDCKDCVFILAIDYSVVSKGVKEKYGDLIGDDKGKSFFDKIIQLPFKMPVASYNIDNYLSKMLVTLGITCTDEELEKYKKLLFYSMGYNPRSIKRLFNAFVLLNKITSGQSTSDNYTKQLLFGTLCLQHSYEKAYNYLVQNRNEIKPIDLIELSDTEHDFLKKWYDNLDMNEIELENLAEFMKILVKVIDKDSINGIEPNEFEIFLRVIGVSSITSAMVDTNVAEIKSKRSSYSFNGTTYVSRKRNKQNIGYLAHDIIADYTTRDNKLTCIDFISMLRQNWKENSWLRKVVIMEDEVENLKSDDIHAYLLDKSDTISYDNTNLYVAKYWGSIDIEKLLTLLPGYSDKIIAQV